MAGHRESPYSREIEDALATAETSQLLTLLFLQAEQVGSTVHAYALAKRANSLRVLTAAAWGKRGGRVNRISPGVIITPLAFDELSGPRGEWFEKVRTTCAAKRVTTSDEVAQASAFLLGHQAGFITGADLLMDGGVTAALLAGELRSPSAASEPGYPADTSSSVIAAKTAAWFWLGAGRAERSHL